MPSMAQRKASNASFPSWIATQSFLSVKVPPCPVDYHHPTATANHPNLPPVQCFHVLCVPMIDFTTFKKHWLKPAPLPPPKGKNCRLFGVNLPFLKERRGHTGPVNQLIPTVRPTASCQNELSDNWRVSQYIQSVKGVSFTYKILQTT